MAKTKEKTKNIGIEVVPPSETCDDKNCPFHGSISLRGKTFVGTVIKSKMRKTAVVSWNSTRFVPKYERYEKTRTRIKVHNSPCINAREGDTVKIIETRPISKTKTFVIIEKIAKEGQKKNK